MRIQTILNQVGTTKGRVAHADYPRRAPTDPDVRFSHPACHVSWCLPSAGFSVLTETRDEVRCPRVYRGAEVTTRRLLVTTGSRRAGSPASAII